VLSWGEVNSIVERQRSGQLLSTYLIINDVPLSATTAHMLVNAWAYEFHNNLNNLERRGAFLFAQEAMRKRANDGR
jgi:hypothetical protein